MFDLFSGASRGEARGIILRVFLVIAGLIALTGAAGFLFGWRDVVRFWPFLGYGLVPVFLASILAAIAAPVLWIGISGELAALRGGAVNLLVTGGGIAAYGLSQSWGDPAGRVQAFSIIHLAIAMVALLLLVASLHSEWRDNRPTPVPVRVAFALFGLVLVTVGVSLVWRLDVFPWPLQSETSTVYGLIFFGAAIYFAYGVWRPVWGNAKGQLVGFLAYDLVLIVPFVRLWFSSPSLSLAVYLAVVTGSAALAIWYLALSPRYRFWAGQ